MQKKPFSGGNGVIIASIFALIYLSCSSLGSGTEGGGGHTGHYKYTARAEQKSHGAHGVKAAQVMQGTNGSHDKHAAQAKEVTLKGEVVDLQCLLMHPEIAKGESHNICAQMCINKGAPVGFLSDGKAYLLLGQEDVSTKDLVIDYLGKSAEIAGIVVDQGGMSAIQIQAIREGFRSMQ